MRKEKVRMSKSSKIGVTSASGRVFVASPYNANFVNEARALNGQFNRSTGCWDFAQRDEKRVREALIKVYGTDGTPGPVLTIRTTPTLCDKPTKTSLFLCGREVAFVRSRDGGAKLGDDVVIVAGGFFSTGSMKYPAIGFKDGTIFELRDVPEGLARKLHEEYHGVDLLDAEGNVVLAARHEEPEAPAPEEMAELPAMLGDGLGTEDRSSAEESYEGAQPQLAAWKVEVKDEIPDALSLRLDVAPLLRLIAKDIATRCFNDLGHPTVGKTVAEAHVLTFFAEVDREKIAPFVGHVLALAQEYAS